MQGSLMGQYNSFQANSSEIPATQFVFQANPKLTIYNMPLTANLRYVSGEDAYSKSMSQFNLGFDINTFKKNLMEKAMSRVSEIKEKGDLGELADLDNISKANLQEKAIAKLKEKLNTPEALESLQNLKEIENLESALNNPAFAEKLEEFNSLKSKYNIKSKEDIAKYSDKIPEAHQKKLIQLYALQEKMDNLIAKKEKLMALQEKFEKYRKMADRLEKLENPSIASALRDPKNLKNFLKQSGGISKVEKMFMMVDHMNFGKSYPYYSPYTVNRIALTGFDVAISPGPLYISVLGGKSQFNLFDNEGRLTMYDRQLYGGKVGLGNQNSTHLHFIAMKAQDDQGNLMQQDSIITDPQSNLILGVDLKISMFKKKFQLSAEAVGSAHNTSDLAPGVDENEIYPTETPDFVRDLFSPNFSTYIGIAYKADMKARLFSNYSDVKAKYEYIGPGYQSMAAPILLRDRLFYDVRWNQHLFNRKLKLSVFHKQEQDNLVPWKAYRTMANSSGAGLSFYSSKGFMFQANYAPYFQSNDVNDIADSSKITNANHMINVTSAYNFKIGSILANSQLSIMEISGEMIPNSSMIPYSSTSSTNFIFNQTLTTAKGLSFNFNTSYIMYENYIQDINIMEITGKSNLLMLDLASSFMLFKKWSNSIGVQYANEDDLDNKFGFYYSTSFPLYKTIRFNLSARQNQYKDPVDLTNNYSSLYINGGINFKF
ncbi:hypothetical protein OAJ56_01590 [Flavobacteriales bacterium]|nr:hypothetical protein [Flavobacteriales bacterium]